MITHFDCFAGPGGITTGFKAAGIKTVAAIEKVASCVETFSYNHPEVLMIAKDIKTVDENDLNTIKNVDIVSAGMPCETFSTAGSKSRSFYDDRQFLFSEGIRIAKILNAKLLLLENVPAITSKKVCKDKEDLIVDLIYEQLTRSGFKYTVDTILDSSAFGVPQKRKRFFILASRENIPLPIPVSINNGCVSVAEAFSDLPKIPANSSEVHVYDETQSNYSMLMRNKSFWLNSEQQSQSQLSYHIPPKHRPGTIRRFRLIKQGQGLKTLFEKFNKDKIKQLQKEKVLPKKWYIQRNRRLDANDVSPTVTSHCLDELIHPYLDRALTVREVARLQSFPDHYEFVGGPMLCPHIYETQDKYEQVGDAVPPLLAYAWGKTISGMLSPVVC